MLSAALSREPSSNHEMEPRTLTEDEWDSSTQRSQGLDISVSPSPCDKSTTVLLYGSTGSSFQCPPRCLSPGSPPRRCFRGPRGSSRAARHGLRKGPGAFGGVGRGEDPVLAVGDWGAPRRGPEPGTLLLGLSIF